MKIARTGRSIMPVLVLIAATALLFAPVLYGGRTFFLRDLTYIFHPWKTLTAEMMQKGEMPLWNPYAYCGMPLAANWQSALFYPFSLLFYFMPFPWALKLYQVLHVFCAGLFGYLAARHWRFSRWASAGFMFALALNGFLVTRLEFLSHLGTGIWLFAVILLLEWPALAAVALSCAFLAGHQKFFLVLFAAAAYAAFAPVRENGRSPLRCAAVAFMAALGLSAVQLIPTLELAAFSARVKGGLDASVAMLYSVPLKDLAGFASSLFQNAAAAPTAGERLQWTSSFAVGIAAVCLAAWGAVGKEKTGIKPWAFLLVVVGTVLAMGDATPVYPWLYDQLFFFRFIRYPVQFMYLAVAGLSLLAMIGLQKSPVRPALALAIAAELLIAGYGFQPTAPDDYYYRKSETAAYLQRHPDGRFIASPGMENDRRIKTADAIEAWQTARGYLYSLTCIPYHLRNAYGFGEPLTVAGIEAAVQAAYAKKTPQEAQPLYAELGVRRLLTRKEMPPVPGYRPVARTPLHVYELAGAPGLCEALNVFLLEAGTSVREGAGYRMTADAGISAAIIVRETWYPGFVTYVNGKKTTVRRWKGLFRTWDIPAGRSVSYHFYRPASVCFGIIVSIITLLLLAWEGLKKLTAAQRNDKAE